MHAKTEVFRISRKTADQAIAELNQVTESIGKKYRCVFDIVHLMLWHLAKKSDDGKITVNEVQQKCLSLLELKDYGIALTSIKQFKRVTVQSDVYIAFRAIAEPLYKYWCNKLGLLLYAYEIPDYIFQVSMLYAKTIPESDLIEFFDKRMENHKFLLSSDDIK